MANDDLGVALEAFGELAPLELGDQERDVRPAKAVGIKTAWLAGGDSAECPQPELVDIHLRDLADLPRLLKESYVAA